MELNKQIGLALDQIKLNSTKTPSLNPPDSRGLSLKDDNEGKLAVLNMLAVAADTLNTYGKTPGQLVNAGKVFNMVLADCTAAEVREAFHTWMHRSAEMPTPFDILNLVQRKGKPPLDRAVYISITKKHYENRNYEEHQYVKDFEKFQMTGRIE